MILTQAYIFSDFVTAMLNYFEWNHVAIVYDYHDALMAVQGEALTSALREDSEFARPYSISFDTTKNPDLRSFLLEVVPHARGGFRLASPQCAHSSQLQYCLTLTNVSEPCFDMLNLITCSFDLPFVNCCYARRCFIDNHPTFVV